MSSDQRLCLHIGLPRTGTKTLQWGLLADHPDVHYLGIHDGNPRYRHTAPWRFHRDAATHELFDQLIWNHTHAPDLERCRAVAEGLREQATASDRALLYSLESLSVHGRPIRRAWAEHLWRVFGRNIKVLIVLRSPVALIESAYGLVLRRNNTQSANAPLWYETIDEWMATADEAASYLDYAETIKIYEGLFGRESVLVLLFEDLVQDPETFIAHVCRHFELERGPQQAPRQSTNERPREWQVSMLRFAVRNRFGNAVFRRIRPHWRFQLLGPSGFGRPHRPTLSRASHRRIEEMTAAGNRWLVEERGLPLAQHGYPL